MTDRQNATFCGGGQARKKAPKKVKKGVDKRVLVWYISKALKRGRGFRVNKK